MCLFLFILFGFSNFAAFILSHRATVGSSGPLRCFYYLYFRSPFWYTVTYLLTFSHFYKLIPHSILFPFLFLVIFTSCNSRTNFSWTFHNHATAQ
jgi:hypothetical protein